MKPVIAAYPLCTLFTVLAISAGLTLSTFAGDLGPSSPPASTMKTLDEVEPRIPIPGSDTPAAIFPINESGSYYLTGDRNTSGTGIQVVTDNVTIDLMGYSLIGPGSGATYGILIWGRKNVEVRNGTIRNFGMNAIFEAFASGRGHRIVNVRVVGNGLSGSYSGIYLTGLYNLVKDCSAETNTGHGIRVGGGNTVTGNTCYRNGVDGINAHSSTVTGNTCSDNGSDGINTSSGSTVTGNTCYGNDGDGISTGSGNTVSGNTANWNRQWGIKLAGNSLVDQNTVINNNQSGSGYGNISSSASSTFGLNHAP